MSRLGPLHVRADEEPDVTTIDYEFVRAASPAGWCGYCGRGGHRQVSCPERPLDDLCVSAKKSRQTS